MTSLNTVGTITSGVWSGTAVAVAKGGTGLTATGSAGQVLSSTGAGTLTWTNVTATTATTAGNITATSNNTLTSLTSLNTVGTITSGVWSGTAVAVAKGGTGLTSVGTSGQVLTTSSTGTLTWTTPISSTIATDITVNGITIGAGAGTITSTNNTVFGRSSLTKNSTGANNVGFGSSALNNNSTGNNNSAIGAASLYENISGSANTAIGKSALQYSLGSHNTGLGAYADISSNNNINNATAIGFYARISASNTIQLGADGSTYNPTGLGSVTTTPITNVKTTGTLTLGGAVVGGVAGASVTYPNIEGSAGQVLTSTGTGTLTWTGGHYIGESFGGGIVFYVYDNGKHGLIAATADYTTTIASNTATATTTNAVKDGINGGISNTDRIIMSQGAGTFAAQVCANFNNVVNAGDVKFADWYLPSKYELNLLYLQRTVVGNFTTTASYWSSTESSAANAWGQIFSTAGTQTASAKTTLNRVRAIRSF